MSTVASRDAYFETGLDVLATAGYGALKLSEVCARLGVTTGSFYHFFKSWGSYSEQLLQHWFETRTLREVEAVRAEPDPQKRIDGLIAYGLALPHGAEAAIRTWSAVSPDVRSLQRKVDQMRFDVVYDAMLEILDEADSASHYASWAVFILVGYEQSTLPHDVQALEWVAQQLLDSLDTQRKANAKS